MDLQKKKNRVAAYCYFNGIMEANMCVGVESSAYVYVYAFYMSDIPHPSRGSQHKPFYDSDSAE